MLSGPVAVVPVPDQLVADDAVEEIRCGVVELRAPLPDRSLAEGIRRARKYPRLDVVEYGVPTVEAEHTVEVLQHASLPYAIAPAGLPDEILEPHHEVRSL